MRVIPNLSKYIQKQLIATKVVVMIVLCGFFLASAETCVSLYQDYKIELKMIEQQIQEVRDRYLKSITKSTWNLAEDEVTLQLEGASQLRTIKYLEVTTETGETFASYGTKPSQKIIARTFPLEYQHFGKANLIGKLYIVASLEGIYQRLYSKIIMMLLTRVFIALIMCGLFLFIFQRLVSRHLTTMAEYTQNLDFKNLGSPLILNRSTSTSKAPDELEKVVRAINEMQLHIKQDIDEIKTAQDETRRERDFTEAALNSQQDTFFLYQPATGKLVRWNRAFRNITGYTDTEINKLIMPTSYFDSKDAKQASDIAKKALKTGSGTIVVDLICKDGRKVPTEYSVSLFKDDNTNQDYLICIGRDITNRVLSERAVKESEKKFRSLFESSMDAILLLDPEKGYLDCNPAAFEMFNIESKEQLYQLAPVDLSPEYQPDGMRSSEKAKLMVEKAMNTGSNLFEWTHKRLNGEEFIASVLATKIELNNQMILQGTIRDITDYKRTQEIMIHSERMLSIGGLAAGMAHEINNPLAGIIQSASVISNRLNDTEMPANLEAAEELGISMGTVKGYMEKRDIFRMIDAIVESGSRMAAIVNNMLSFARKSDTEVSSHNLAELIDNTLELSATDYDLKKHYDFKMINIEKDYAADIPLIPCESAKIQQVILNILRNGAQAMQKAKTDNPLFIIRTRLNKGKNTVCIEIQDNGPGMDEITRRRVFEPFFTTKSAEGGTGLGLSVSYFIITENHGGEISVESTPGSGAHFTIDLPLKRKKRHYPVP